MNVALILSGGVGTRLGGDVPKQYRMVGGKPVIAYCLETLAQQKEIEAIQIVAEPSWQEFIMENRRKPVSDDSVLKASGKGEPDSADSVWKLKFRGFSLPGDNRQLSIWNGLQDIRKFAGEEDVVLIHDAARPLLSAELIQACFKGMEGYEGVLPVLPMKDTVYLSENGQEISGLLDRKQIFAGQAPEAFRIGSYYRANQSLFPDRIRQMNGSTEPAILAGMKIRMIPGDERNFKITTREDLTRFEEIMKK